MTAVTFPRPPLTRRYLVLAFDWDGTAVESRSGPTDALRERTEPLAERGVRLVVVTGTNFENIDRQYFRRLTREAKPAHLACVNRGSEVFGFGPHGDVEVRHRRVATVEENRRMDRIAVTMQEELASTYGLRTKIVLHRFNRRKLDLIPVPDWVDPPKERIGELLEAVNARLDEAGVTGGIRAVMDRVAELARELRIDLKLTTDVKHVEFGLTDKADSIAFLTDEFVRRRGIAPEQIMIAGDEFGPIDGFEGSDFRTFTLPGAAYVSVGKEPNGVPDGVLHLGGGVPAFLDILDRQLDLLRESQQHV